MPLASYVRFALFVNRQKRRRSA